MADLSTSAHLQVLFESALQAYEKQTNIALADHPFAVRLQICHDVESIITILLQGEAQVFSNFQENDRIMKSIKTIVSNLTTLSTTASLRDDSSLVRQNALMGLPRLRRQWIWSSWRPGTKR